jgi:hypothetical protein
MGADRAAAKAAVHLFDQQNAQKADFEVVVLPAAIDAPTTFFREELKKLDRAFAMVHSKVILVDPLGPDPVVLTGSHNLGPKASGTNDENLLIIRNAPGLAAAYATNIMAVYNQYRWRFRRHLQPPSRRWKGLVDSDNWQRGYLQADSPALREINSGSARSGSASTAGPAVVESAPGGRGEGRSIVTATKPETVELEFTAATRSDERSLSGAAAHGDYLFVAPDEGVSIVRMRRKQDSPDYDHAQVCPVDADAEPGVGKTHIAQALAHLAIRAGAEARFIKTSRALVDLAGGHADGTWTRLRELARPAVLVLDDFAMRELTPPKPTTSTN